MIERLKAIAEAAGGWAAAVKAAFGFGEKVADMVDRGNERTAGRNEVKAETNAQSAEVNANVAKATVDTTDAVALELLRDGRG